MKYFLQKAIIVGRAGGEMFVFLLIVCRVQYALIPVLRGHSETIAWRNVSATTPPPAITRPAGVSVPPDIRESWYVMRHEPADCQPLVTSIFIPSPPPSLPLFLKIIYVRYGHNFR